LVAM